MACARPGRPLPSAHGPLRSAAEAAEPSGAGRPSGAGGCGTGDRLTSPQIPSLADPTVEKGYAIATQGANRINVRKVVVDLTGVLRLLDI